MQSIARKGEIPNLQYGMKNKRYKTFFQQVVQRDHKGLPSKTCPCCQYCGKAGILWKLMNSNIVSKTLSVSSQCQQGQDGVWFCNNGMVSGFAHHIAEECRFWLREKQQKQLKVQKTEVLKKDVVSNMFTTERKHDNSFHRQRDATQEKQVAYSLY